MRPLDGERQPDKGMSEGEVRVELQRPKVRAFASPCRSEDEPTDELFLLKHWRDP